jgi:protein phosphatase-4 regulatory subunit 3
MNRYYVMRNNVVQTILRLTRRREKYLVVAAVRFLRTCIALKVGFFPTNMTSTFSLMWTQS